MIASGSRMLKEESPNTRTKSAITQSEAGGLSTVIELPASDDPYRNASQFEAPACTAAE